MATALETAATRSGTTTPHPPFVPPRAGRPRRRAALVVGRLRSRGLPRAGARSGHGTGHRRLAARRQPRGGPGARARDDRHGPPAARPGRERLRWWPRRHAGDGVPGSVSTSWPPWTTPSSTWSKTRTGIAPSPPPPRHLAPGGRFILDAAWFSPDQRRAAGTSEGLVKEHDGPEGLQVRETWRCDPRPASAPHPLSTSSGEKG